MFKKYVETQSIEHFIFLAKGTLKAADFYFVLPMFLYTDILFLFILRIELTNNSTGETFIKRNGIKLKFILGLKFDIVQPNDTNTKANKPPHSYQCSI